jgi:protein-tyrosine phosphatase
MNSVLPRFRDGVAFGRAIGYNRGMKKKVIFVCSANYYRSRYAEHYFNWLAKREQLGWHADSRGLMVGAWGNLGPISRYTVDALQERGIPLEDQPRGPKALTLADLAEADLVVAVKEAEHRAMMAQQFPLWKDRIEYWHVDDLDCAPVEDALPHLEEQIHALVGRLRTADGHNGSNGHATARHAG